MRQSMNHSFMFNVNRGSQSQTKIMAPNLQKRQFKEEFNFMMDQDQQ